MAAAKKSASRKPSPIKPAAGKPAAKATKSPAPKRPAAKKAPAKRIAAPKMRAKKAPPATGDLHVLGARVISVFGKRRERVLVDMPAELATHLFPEPLEISGHIDVITGAERDVAEIKKRDKALGESALARAVVVLAFEIAHPFNSATSKSMCTRELREAVDRLRELAPEKEEADQLDDLSARRAKRVAGA